MAGTLSQQRLEEQRKRADRLREAELVHQMRVAGKSYTAIASALHVSANKASTLHREHIEYLQELDHLGALEASIRVQDDRYEALLGAVWDRALGGDMFAIKECRQILDSITAREVKVTAMITKTNDNGDQTTLVAEGSSGEYIKALEGMSR